MDHVIKHYRGFDTHVGSDKHGETISARPNAETIKRYGDGTLWPGGVWPIAARSMPELAGLVDRMIERAADAIAEQWKPSGGPARPLTDWERELLATPEPPRKWCYHPLSCSTCRRLNEACGKHYAGQDREHATCSGH